MAHMFRRTHNSSIHSCRIIQKKLAFELSPGPEALQSSLTRDTGATYVLPPPTVYQTPAKTHVPEKMMMAQLKSDAQVGPPVTGAKGKNEKTKPTSKKASEMSLMGPPHLPSEKRLGSKGSPRRRFSRTLPMEAMYEKISAALETERIALRAALEPKLMADSTRATLRQTSSCRRCQRRHDR